MGENTLEHRVTFSVLPYGVNIPEAHFKETSPGPVGSLTGSGEGQVILATEVRSGLTSSAPSLCSEIPFIRCCLHQLSLRRQWIR